MLAANIDPINSPPSPLRGDRYRQALQVGYVEMERIVEEIIISEFTRIGEILLEKEYEVEVVVFDTQSELEDRMFICGAGLNVKKGYMNNAIVYTGDPHNFKFILQTQNFASKTTEESVDYHKLTPKWFHNRVKYFMQTTCRDVDISHIEAQFTDDWAMLEAPFSVKMKNKYGYYNAIATAESIEEAFKIGSYVMEEHNIVDGLMVEDRNGREVK